MADNAGPEYVRRVEDGPEAPKRADKAKVCVVMVGLPARGKTFIARRLTRYLNWIGVVAKIFNVGEYRRSTLGARQPASFFSPDNGAGLQQRRELAETVITDMMAWFREADGQVAVFDATNSTRERRTFVSAKVAAAAGGVQMLFVESLCENPDILQSNIEEVKLRMPDYQGMDREAAIDDFKARIAHYERAYQPLDDDSQSYIKLKDAGRQFVMNRLSGYLQSRMAFFLINLHTAPRVIYLSRHGESEYNVLGRIGGDPPLSERGRRYAAALAAWMREETAVGGKGGEGGKQGGGVKLWTSTLLRTRETGAGLEGLAEGEVLRWRALDEIDAGICEGLTYEEIQEQYPQEFALRDQDKYKYRYPRGESYYDVVQRLEPVIMELERQNNLMLVCHQAVARCLLAYFQDLPANEMPYIKVPLHTVLRLTPVAYGCRIEAIPLNVECVDTHRDRPANVATTREPAEALATVPAHD